MTDGGVTRRMTADDLVMLSARSKRQLWLAGLLLVLATALTVDWFLPSYVPFPTVYVIAAGFASWLGGLHCGLAVSAVILADLTVHESIHDGGAAWPVTCGLLARLVLYTVVIWTAVRGRQSIARLVTRATTDPLTGLCNRRQFDDIVGAELRRAWRYHRPVCVAVLDVNRFKAFNDTHGHSAGDHALIGIADRLRADVRATDTVARIGGDEFAILFPETDIEDARVAVAHAVELVADYYSAGVTAGVNFLEPTLDAVLDVGDRDMYRRKRAAREEPEA